jgi:hypothetical protein
LKKLAEGVAAIPVAGEKSSGETQADSPTPGFHARVE